MRRACASPRRVSWGRNLPCTSMLRRPSSVYLTVRVREAGRSSQGSGVDMLFSVAAVPGTVLGLLQSYGYVGVFVLVALESLGIPLPGETALLTAAALAAAGHLALVGVMVAAAAGAIAGDTAG